MELQALLKLMVKTAMSLTLTHSCKGTDLAELDLSKRSYIPEEVVFQLGHLSKQSQPSHHNIIFFFPKFEEDRCLCPVETLKVYEEKAAPFSMIQRRSMCFNHLLVNMGQLF